MSNFPTAFFISTLPTKAAVSRRKIFPVYPLVNLFK